MSARAPSLPSVIATLAGVGLAALVPASAGVAHEVGGGDQTTAEIAALERSLRPGQAEVLVAPDLFTWNPRAGLGVRIRVLARLPAGFAERRGQQVYARAQSPREPCAQSFASDGGLPIDLYSQLRLEGGIIDAFSHRRYTWREPQTVRFCVWLNGSPDQPSRPVVQDVVFHDRLFGATVAHVGSLSRSSRNTADFGSAATVPYRQHFEERGGGGCRRTRITRSRRQPDGFEYVIGERFSGACSRSWSFSLLAGPAGRRNGGTVSYTESELGLPVSRAPIRHVGDCFVGSFSNYSINGERTVGEARTFLRAIGCRPGRVLRAAYSPSQPRGMVFAFTVHGGVVPLVPRGTVVDMVVNP